MIDGAARVWTHDLQAQQTGTLPTELTERKLH